MRGRYQQTRTPIRRLTAPLRLADASTLALVVEKENAHNYGISSVDYAPDGKTIVSACLVGTIKVWDAGACNGHT